MVMTTLADVPAVLPGFDTAATEDAAEEAVVAGVLPGPPPDEPQPLSPTSTVAATTAQTSAAIVIFLTSVRAHPTAARAKKVQGALRFGA